MMGSNWLTVSAFGEKRMMNYIRQGFEEENML
jgi:hypothetical protein